MTAAPGGRRWMAMRQLVAATYGDQCHLCGHGGAEQVDHLVPVSIRPDLAWHLPNLRPAHGVPGNKCPTCGLACNQRRGAKAIDAIPPPGTAPPGTPVPDGTPPDAPPIGHHW